ncbi:hypothetical protein Tco_1527339, partial [Tanacetum coccineum]
STFRIPPNLDDGNSTPPKLLELSKISTGSSTKFNLASTQISSKGTCSVGSAKHFLKFDTWNVS